MRYKGPLRDEPLAVELHNTIYATSSGGVDGLADPAHAVAWLEALAPRLGQDWLPPGAWPSAGELVVLRAGVRRALRAAAGGEDADQDALDAINAASRRAPRVPVAVWDEDTPRAHVAVWGEGAPRAPVAAWPEGARLISRDDYGDATRADIVLATFAADAIELLTGEHRHDLRTCGAPRCVLMFLSEHPRREWCSDRCGNRARQARHYERHSRR